HLGTGHGAPPERHRVAAVAEADDADPHALILVEGHVDHGLLAGGPGKTWTLPEGGGGGGGDETGRQRAREERASRGGREFGHSASFVECTHRAHPSRRRSGPCASLHRGFVRFAYSRSERFTCQVCSFCKKMLQECSL